MKDLYQTIHFEKRTINKILKAYFSEYQDKAYHKIKGIF